MTSSVAETRYGRRGGGWLPTGATPGAPPPTPATTARRSHVRDTSPDTIARNRAHADPRRARGTCPADPTGRQKRGGGPCACTPDPADLADVWAGRARMAWARHDAGQPLDAHDEQAIARHPRQAVRA